MGEERWVVACSNDIGHCGCPPNILRGGRGRAYFDIQCLAHQNIFLRGGREGKGYLDHIVLLIINHKGRKGMKKLFGLVL